MGKNVMNTNRIQLEKALNTVQNIDKYGKRPIHTRGIISSYLEMLGIKNDFS